MKILMQMSGIGRAGDRHNPVLALKQPGKRDLRRGCIIAGGIIAQNIKQLQICLEVFRCGSVARSGASPRVQRSSLR